MTEQELNVVVPLAPAQSEQLQETKELQKRVKRKTPVDSDTDADESKGHVQGLDAVVPGVAALQGTRHVMPFMSFLAQYADRIYPDIKPERRMAMVRKKHKGWIYVCGALDGVLQVVLVAAVLAGPLVLAFIGLRETLGLGTP